MKFAKKVLDPNGDSPSRSVWFTVRQAADYIGVGVEFIYDACASGTLKHVRLEGRRSIRILSQWLDDWMLQYAVGNR